MCRENLEEETRLSTITGSTLKVCRKCNIYIYVYIGQYITSNGRRQKVSSLQKGAYSKSPTWSLYVKDMFQKNNAQMHKRLKLHPKPNSIPRQRTPLKTPPIAAITSRWTRLVIV